MHLCDTVKLQFQDADADCVKLPHLIVQYTHSMFAELQLYLYLHQQAAGQAILNIYFKIHLFSFYGKGLEELYLSLQ